MIKCNNPWMVQVFQNGTFYFFETLVEADEFAKSFEKVYLGPIYNPNAGLQNERLVMEMVVFIVEKEFREKKLLTSTPSNPI